MDPGHVCLNVHSEGDDYYTDVGYAAPFFEAYPLRRSFEVNSASETFTYAVADNSALVTRVPGPIKSLSFKEASQTS